MDPKKLIWIGFLMGSTVGSLIPELWGAGMFSFSSIFFSGAGATLGIWLGYKISQNY